MSMDFGAKTVENPAISVVIVTWNVRRLLEANLRRLFSLKTKHQFEVIVVDNGSHDGSAAMVATDFPAVQLIRNDWDAGFAGPNNQALRLARGEVCVLLNPDMLVAEGTLDATYERLMADRSIGVMGIKLIGQSGKPIVGSVRRLPDIWSQLVILLKLQHLFPRLLNRYLYTDFDFEKSQDVDQVRGSYFAFRRELLQSVGYLDPGYHIWFEEVDYCLRVKKAGLRIFYDASISAHDYVGKGVSQMRRFETQLIFGNSMQRYFWKWHPKWQWAAVQLFRPFGLLAALVMDVVNDLRKKV